MSPLVRSPFLHLLWLPVLLAGCIALEARLPAVPPPPNLTAGAFLVEVPEAAVERWERPAVRAHRDRVIPELYGIDPERASRILAHQIVVGMTSQQVVWAMLAHPTRVVDPGPPSGHAYLYEPGRWYVRFSSEGRVIAAGRY